MQYSRKEIQYNLDYSQTFAHGQVKIAETRVVQKLENTMIRVFWKKIFHHFKKHLYQNGNAENVPVVAGRVVLLLRPSHLLAIYGRIYFLL